MQGPEIREISPVGADIK